MNTLLLANDGSFIQTLNNITIPYFWFNNTLKYNYGFWNFGFIIYCTKPEKVEAIPKFDLT
jgi:hypothetical protein